MQNSSLFDQLILCHNQKECKKLAVLYFGDAVSPQNIRYIKAKTDKI